MQAVVQQARQVARSAAKIDDSHRRHRLNQRQQIEKRLLAFLLKRSYESDSRCPYELAGEMHACDVGIAEGFDGSVCAFFRFRRHARRLRQALAVPLTGSFIGS